MIELFLLVCYKRN